MNVGFIGTGTMGQPMVANLLKKDFAVLAYDVVPAALAAAVKLGATAAGSIADVAKRSDLIVTMLPSSAQRRSRLPGRRRHPGGGAGRTPLRGHVHDRPERVAPSGGRARPQTGPLPRRAGLRRRARCRRRHAGDHGRRRGARPGRGAAGAGPRWAPTSSTWAPWAAARSAKLCNNLIAGVAAVAVSEAFRIAEGFGVDPKILTDVISKSSGNTWVMQHSASGAGPRGARRLQPRLRAGFHDRSDGQGSRPGRERRARAAHPGHRRAGGAAGAPPGVLSRLRPEGLHRDLRLPEALEPRRACLTGGPEMAPGPPGRSRRPG